MARLSHKVLTSPVHCSMTRLYKQVGKYVPERRRQRQLPTVRGCQQAAPARPRLRIRAPPKSPISSLVYMQQQHTYPQTRVAKQLAPEIFDN